MKLSETKVFQKIKVNDKKYRKSAFNLLEILLIFVIEVCISLSITTFFGSRKLSQTTVTIYDHNKTANLMLGITIFVACLAIVSFYWYLTRKEEQEIKFLERELKKIKAKREEAKLNYIYKEFFSSDNPDFNFKYTKLEKELQKDYNSFHSKLYNLLKLTVSKKSKETKTF